MTDSVANFLDRQGFALESSALKSVSAVFAREADLALRGEVSSLQMIDSHLALGRAGGPLSPASVIVVDAGGTNLRGATVSFPSGADAALIGEAFMRASDKAAMLAEFKAAKGQLVGDLLFKVEGRRNWVLYVTGGSCAVRSWKVN